MITWADIEKILDEEVCPQDYGAAVPRILALIANEWPRADRIASILEANFWDGGDYSGTDAEQRAKFKEVAREISRPRWCP